MKIEIDEVDSVVIDGRVYVINEDGNVVIDGRVYVPADESEYLQLARRFLDKEPDKHKPWPQVGDTCFCLWETGVVSTLRFCPASLHTLILEQGNLFPTHEAAEAERDRRAAETRVLRRLRELSGHWRPDWDDGAHRKFHPCWGREEDKLLVTYTTISARAPNRWHGPEESWERVIEEIPDDVRRMMG